MPAQQKKVVKRVPGQKGKKPQPIKLSLDAAEPIGDQLFEVAELEKYLKERIKVDGRTGNLGEAVVVARSGSTDLTVTVQPGVPFAKRYLKYLTKKFLKKRQMKEFLRVIATDKTSYKLKYYQMQEDDEEEADE